MTVAEDWAFELDGFPFGVGTGYRTENLEWEKPEIRVQDRELPRQDGRRMGRDYLDGTLLAFTFGIEAPGPEEAFSRLSALRLTWQAEDARSTPGEVVPLVYQRPGSDPRVVYGRPRNFTPRIPNVAAGLAAIVADFQCVDDLFYSNIEGSLALNLVPPSAGGLTAPLVAPLSTVAQSEEPGEFTVGGEAPAWVRPTFHGPVTRPVCEVLGVFRLELAVSLADGQSVTVDPRPWSRGIRRENGANLGGSLTADSPRLSRLKVPPGDHVVAFRGEDLTGTASMDFRWRNANRSL